MMQNQKTPGRNDPCWCGSGKKYKQCHQRADQERASEKLQKQTLWNALGEFALERKYEIDFNAAAKFFFGVDAALNLADDADEQIAFERALDYFLFDYAFPDNSRLIERFTVEQARMLSPRQRAWLAAWAHSAPALLEITSIERGVGVHARDLLTNESYDVRDKLRSEMATRWIIMFTRVLPADDHFELGSSGLEVAPYFRGKLLAYVKDLRANYKGRYPEATVPEFMRAHAHLINQYILYKLGSEMQAPNLLTPEGDLEEHAVATYAVLEHAQTLARLRAAPEFQELETDARATRTFAWNETDASLELLRLHGAPFEWHTPTDAPNAVRGLGMLNLSLDELTLEAMSRRRLDAGKALLEKQLGDAVRFREERIESLADALARYDDDEFPDDFDDDGYDDAGEWGAGESPFKAPRPDFSPPPAATPEQRALLRANYNQTWIDQKIPALDNQTPRQAVHTFGGRLQVIRLLKDFEVREAENAQRGKIPFDWSAVARELDLSDQEFLNEGHIESSMHELLALLMELTLQHQVASAWDGWKKFRELFPIRRAKDLWFAQVWDLETELTELAMELAHQLARFKRFDEARALLDDYIALDADAWDWALAERQAVEIENAIYSDPRAVQQAIAELEKLAQEADTAFQALSILGELQAGLLDAPGAALETLQRAEQAADDDMEKQRAYGTLSEFFLSFRAYNAGKSFWHEANDALAKEDRDDVGLARLLLACGRLDEAESVIEKIEYVESREYFSGILAARRGDLDAARRIWRTRLAKNAENFQRRWFDWAELSLYLHDSDAVLEKLDPAAFENHQMMHWYRALAYAQRGALADAAHAADEARAAMREQMRRMDYADALRRERAHAARFGLSDAALRALNLDAPPE